MEQIADCVAIYVTSLFKFLGGPAAGLVLGVDAWLTVSMTIAGMMTSVLAISFLGPSFRGWLKQRFGGNKPLFSKRNRRFVRLWKRYGIFGIAFLTPILFSPVVGALMVNAVGGCRKKIVSYMTVSATFWAIVITHSASFAIHSLW